MDFTEYQQRAMRTLGSNLLYRDQLALGGLGLTGEAGEVADIIKKFLYHNRQFNVGDMKEELGDVLWYLACLANVLDLELGDIAIANLKKLEKRYPDGFNYHTSRLPGETMNQFEDGGAE